MNNKLTTEKTFEAKCSEIKQQIVLNARQLCDFELIVNGGFSPLDGFLKEDDYKSVVKNMRLANGHLWTMPIVLSINEKQKDEFQHCDQVVLIHETGLPLAIMDISKEGSIYKFNIKEECEKVYGAYDTNHPYVKILQNAYEMEEKIYNIGGEITEFKLPPHYDFVSFRKTPEQLKSQFREMGWTKVVGFQTRNPMHRSHFELTKYAQKVAGEDCKILLHPVIGVTQDCDVNYHTRVKCYKKLLKYYDENECELSLLNLSMRMAGPREAVWHAQIRKNHGCTHFVVGRDHAGPSYKKQDGSDFYGHYDAQDLLLKHADEIGIIPVISKMIVYALPKGEENEMKGTYMAIDTVDTEKYDVMKISGTQQREMLNKGETIPAWFTFDSIAEELNVSYKPLNKKGLVLYFVGMSGSGKSTIANLLMSKLKEVDNREITYLDGDIVRRNLSKGLGFSVEDRSTNVQRIGFVASEVAKHGGIAVCSNIAPFKNDRDINRESVTSKNGIYVEIYMKTYMEILEKRDVKGLYKLARQGLIKEFTGISSPFEEPENPEILLEGDGDISKSVETIFEYLQDKGFIC